MSSTRKISRRKFVRAASLATAGLAAPVSWPPRLLAASDLGQPLGEFSYSDVTLASGLHEKQLENTHSVLMGLSEDSLLKPFRQMSGQPAPGDKLGGWYKYDPNYDFRKDDAGFAPAATFGQWVSALARAYAITGDQKIREKVLRLNRQYAETISDDFYEKNRFPAYCYDKLVCGLIDSHQLAGDPDAYRILDGFIFGLVLVGDVVSVTHTSRILRSTRATAMTVLPFSRSSTNSLTAASSHSPESEQRMSAWVCARQSRRSQD